MKELVNLIVNVLGQMDNNENIRITRSAANEYKFEGISKDMDETPYKYEITTKFLPVEDESETSQNQQIEILKSQVEQLTAAFKNKANGNNATIQEEQEEEEDK